MYTPTRSEFAELARTHNLIPVYREIIADIDTPVSAFQKLGEAGDCFLLESVEGGERLGRFSFLGSEPVLVLSARGNEAVIRAAGRKETRRTDDPLALLQELMVAYRPARVPDLPGFSGGAVGYVGYDAVRYFEKIPRTGEDDLKLPDLAFMLTDTLLVFDHLKHKIKVVANAFVDREDPGTAYSRAVAKVDALISKLQRPLDHTPLVQVAPYAPRPVESSIPKTDFLDMVERAKGYITAGDVFQVVLSQRFETEISARPFDIYRILRTINPSPYMVYLKIDDLVIAGTSPEPLIKVEGDRVFTRPIAGTRPRGATPEEDRALENELLADEKERAEHIMLVDLGRNDLGRVCESGTVQVEEMMTIERYSHVMHIVSTVAGRLKPGNNAFHALRAAFPAGTVSGAPKIRAMEIIDELEPTLRGPYAGVYGYFSYAGDLDCGITIRTILMKGNKAYIQAGAGIVADSVPEREYEETINKALALLAAVDLADKALL